jgi:curved DNA-binding protein CbpA
MRLGDDARTEEDRVPRLAPDCDPTALELTPSEGYLLSRIDGHTSNQTLRQMGPLPPAEVDRLLEQWMKQGVIHFGEEAEEPPVADPAPGPSAAALAGLRVDESLELPVEIQEQVIAFTACLDRPYHEVLGVAPDADVRAIKKAYYTLSKVYHPDRYFRRKLGPFADEIERCFKKLLEAYELLSDPATRAEVQQAASEARSAAPSGPSGLEMRRRMRRRLHKRTGHMRVREERKRKAKGFFESGMSAFAREHWPEAAGSVRLAIAFDPANEVYRERFVEVQRRAHEERATTLLKKAESALEMRDYRDALSHFEEAIHYRPYDAELCFRAARLAWQVADDLKKAKDMAASACELDPGNAAYHRTLGQIYAAAGFESNARRELQTALEIDPRDKEAKSALRAL